MLELLEKLLILQHGDQQIRDVDHALQLLPEEKITCERASKKADQSLEAIRLRQQEHDLQLKKLEVDVLAKREQVNRYRRQQLETRKNDEYAALAHEIDAGEKAIAIIEDREILLMEAAVPLAAEMMKAQEAYTIEQKRVSNVFASLDERRTNLQARKEELLNKRPRLVEGIDEDELDRYERLFKSKEGTAIVPIEHHVCTGCHMKVTMQTVLATKAAKEIIHCSQCGRMLYCDEE